MTNTTNTTNTTYLDNIELSGDDCYELLCRIHKNGEIAHYFMHSEQENVTPVFTATGKTNGYLVRREQILINTTFNNKKTIAAIDLTFANERLLSMIIPFAYQPETDAQITKIIDFVKKNTILLLMTFDKKLESEDNNIENFKFINHIKNK